MFRSTTIIRELVLNLAKVKFMLKHSVKLSHYKLFGDVAACHRVACVFVLCRMTLRQEVYVVICYLVMWQHVTEITDINNIDKQLDATITAY